MKNLEIKPRPITIKSTPTKQTVFINNEILYLPNISNEGGYVYIFSIANKMKIGKTKDWKQREKTHCQNNGIKTFDTRVVTIKHTNFDQNERILLNYFEDYKICGEWFNSSQLKIAIEILKTLKFSQDVKFLNKKAPLNKKETKELLKILNSDKLAFHKALITDCKDWLDQGDFWEYQKILIRDFTFRRKLEYIINLWKVNWSNKEQLLYFNTIEMVLYLTESLVRFKQSNNLNGLCVYLEEGSFPKELMPQIISLFNQIPSNEFSIYTQKIKNIEEAHSKMLEYFCAGIA